MVHFSSHPYARSGRLEDFCKLLKENIGKAIGFTSTDGGDFCGQIVGAYRDNKFGAFLIFGDEKIDLNKINRDQTTIDLEGRIPAKNNYPESTILKEANPLATTGFQDRLHRLVFERFKLTPFEQIGFRQSTLPVLPDVNIDELKQFCEKRKPTDCPVIVLRDKSEFQFSAVRFDAAPEHIYFTTTNGEVSVSLSQIEDFVCKLTK